MNPASSICSTRYHGYLLQGQRKGISFEDAPKYEESLQSSGKAYSLLKKRIHTSFNQLPSSPMNTLEVQGG